MKRLIGGIAAALVAASCASAATEQRQLTATPFLRGLDGSLYLASAPGEPDNVYVVEQRGVIRVATRGTIRAKPFLDIRRLVVSGGEQGLLSVAFHPKYKTNHKFYVDYTDTAGNTRVVEYWSNGSRRRTTTA